MIKARRQRGGRHRRARRTLNATVGMRIVLAGSVVALLLLALPAFVFHPDNPRPVPTVRFTENAELAQAVRSVAMPAYNAIRARESARVDMIMRLDDYLLDTPMRGLGEVMLICAERMGYNVMDSSSGPDPRLCAAVARAESGCGANCFRSYNPFGMMGCSFSSFSEAVESWFALMEKRTCWSPYRNGYDLCQAPAYCQLPDGSPNMEYAANVTAEMQRI